VEEPAVRGHDEGRCALLVEGTEGEELTPLPLKLDAALSNEGGQIDAALDGVDLLPADP
jgi:hypothetical protein